VKVTPESIHAEGDLHLPAGIGNAHVEGTITATGFDLEGEAALVIGGFSASGTVRITQDELTFSGYLGIPGGSSIYVFGNIQSSGDFIFQGSGSVTVPGAYLVSGSFEFKKAGSVVTLKATGTFQLSNTFVVNSEIDFSSVGGITGSGKVSFGGKTFTSTFSLSSSGVPSVSGSLSLSGSVKGPLGNTLVSTSGTGSIYADSSGNVKGSFSGKATGPLGNSVDVSSDLTGSLGITIKAFGATYTISLG